MPNDAATWHLTGELYRDGVTTLFEAVSAARPGVRTASVNEMTERGSWASTFALVRAALASGEAADPGEAGSTESRDFATTIRALLPDPLASDLVTHARCAEDDDYAFYSAIDLLGLSTMVGLFSVADPVERPAVTWWSQYTTDAAHHAGGPRSGIALDGLRDCDARLGALLDHLDERGILDDTLILLTADHGFEGADESVLGSWTPGAVRCPRPARGPVARRGIRLPLPGRCTRMTVLVCARCGTSLDADADEQSGMAALAWVSSWENGRDLRYCPSCARDNLRSIEGKLDAEFW